MNNVQSYPELDRVPLDMIGVIEGYEMEVSLTVNLFPHIMKNVIIACSF